MDVKRSSRKSSIYPNRRISSNQPNDKPIISDSCHISKSTPNEQLLSDIIVRYIKKEYGEMPTVSPPAELPMSDISRMSIIEDRVLELPQPEVPNIKVPPNEEKCAQINKELPRPSNPFSQGSIIKTIGNFFNFSFPALKKENRQLSVNSPFQSYASDIHIKTESREWHPPPRRLLTDQVLFFSSSNIFLDILDKLSETQQDSFISEFKHFREFYEFISSQVPTNARDFSSATEKFKEYIQELVFRSPSENLNPESVNSRKSNSSAQSNFKRRSLHTVDMVTFLFI